MKISLVCLKASIFLSFGCFTIASLATDVENSTPAKYVVCSYDVLSAGQGYVVKRYLSNIMPGPFYDVDIGSWGPDKQAVVSMETYHNYKGPNQREKIDLKFNRALEASSDLLKFRQNPEVSGSNKGGCFGLTTLAKAKEYVGEQKKGSPSQPYPVDMVNWDMVSDTLLTTPPSMEAAPTSEVNSHEEVAQSTGKPGTGILLANPDPVYQTDLDEKRASDQANAEKAQLALELQKESDAQFEAKMKDDTAKADKEKADEARRKHACAIGDKENCYVKTTGQ